VAFWATMSGYVDAFDTTSSPSFSGHPEFHRRQCAYVVMRLLGVAAFGFGVGRRTADVSILWFAFLAASRTRTRCCLACAPCSASAWAACGPRGCRSSSSIGPLACAASSRGCSWADGTGDISSRRPRFSSSTRSLLENLTPPGVRCSGLRSFPRSSRSG
jgi:hypothetical protein